MNILRPLWDYKDDYYFTTIGADIEINIRAYSESEFSLWIYEYSNDEELIDAYYKDMQDLEKELNETIGAKVIVPTVESLLKLTRGEKMYDPKAAYYERMNDNQKRGLSRRRGSKFRDSIGGCSSNYRD